MLEPKITGPKATNITRKIHLDGCFQQDAIGFYGDIWLLWDTNLLNVTMEKSQSIHSY